MSPLGILKALARKNVFLRHREEFNGRRSNSNFDGHKLIADLNLVDLDLCEQDFLLFPCLVRDDWLVLVATMRCLAALLVSLAS